MCRYRERVKERDRDSKQQLRDLVGQLEELRVDNRQLAARQRVMDDLVQHQEFHLHVLTNLKACPALHTIACGRRLHM